MNAVNVGDFIECPTLAALTLETHPRILSGSIAETIPCHFKGDATSFVLLVYQKTSVLVFPVRGRNRSGSR